MSDDRGIDDGYSPIPELNQLKAFDDSDEREPGMFAVGFELLEFGHDFGVREWLDMADSQDPELPRHLDRFICFAVASLSGSYYALWRCDDRSDLATLPVVRFGDEGDLDIVASGLRDLFRLLALDNEWYDPLSEVEEEDHSDGHEDYLAWLDRTFGLAPPDDPDVVLDAAEDEYAQRFADWLAQFAPVVAENLALDGNLPKPGSAAPAGP